MEVHEQMAKVDQSVASLKPLSADKMVGERLVSKTTSGKRGKSPITAASYTIACLQTATNSFSQECLVGEGSLGRVYRAEFPNGKVEYLSNFLYCCFSKISSFNFVNLSSFQFYDFTQSIYMSYKNHFLAYHCRCQQAFGK